MDQEPPAPKIVVIGLGYVGLPVAVALARHFDVVGFDIDTGRIGELRDSHDRTGEIDQEILAESKIRLTSDRADCIGADIFIVTVPTPVDGQNRPDLSALLAATSTVGGLVDPSRRPTIVYESTVYPGVTEEVCGGALEAMGLVRGRDFRLGYSPERINPGDREHSIDRITKVIAGEDPEVVEQLAQFYGAITSGGVFRAASIKAAEAAKAIENAQRDINVAFVNEVAQIVEKVGVSVWDVLDAARTKWNFLPFEPGLVGGHCIGVDPFYLSHLAEAHGVSPRVVLSGRGRNDSMGAWIADRVHEKRGGKSGSVLVLGATFKENVPDIRNSRVFDVIDRLEALGHSVRLADPLADPSELEREYGRSLSPAEAADVVIGAVPHTSYRALDAEGLGLLVKPNGLVADIKGMWRNVMLRSDIARWSL